MEFSPMRIAIVLPVFNDWISFRLLASEIDRVAADAKWEASIFAIDDGSVTEDIYTQVDFQFLGHLRVVEIVHLTHNVGHQRAIAIGLCHAVSLNEWDAVVVMDADGEDKPQAINILLDQFVVTPDKIIFARRGARNTSMRFKIFYALYRGLFSLLTGNEISFGNFCAIPRLWLQRVTQFPEIWNHLPGALMRSRLPYTTILIDRGQRYDGDSKMGFVSLISHGLSSMSVFVEAVLIRIIIATLIVSAICLVVIAGLVTIRMLSLWVTPGWTTTTVIGITMISIQSFLLSMISIFVVLQGRSTIKMPPAKIYGEFIRGREIYQKPRDM
jgi:glycosyltransferase involved in cell wall biosynthesis